MSIRLSTEQFIKKAMAVHGNKYDYSKVEYKDSKTKVCIICPEHGEFWQTPRNHLVGKGCFNCFGKKKLLNSEFIEKARQVHGDKYDYSKVKYKNANTKVCIICPEHGEFWQTPSKHIRGRGCEICGGSKKKTTQQFVNEAKELNNKFDYSKVDYINAYTPICIICPEHGEFYKKPHDFLSGKINCPKCKISKGENKIREYLDSNHINYIYNKHSLTFLDKLKPDFYLPDYNLVIEYDGEQHFKPIKFGNYSDVKAENIFEKTKQNDELKNKLCEENNVKVLRISYIEYNDIENILNNRFKVNC